MTQLAQDAKTATLGEVVTAIQQRSAALGELLKPSEVFIPMRQKRWLHA